MSMNSGGGGRPGRVNPQAAAYLKAKKAKKQYQESYDRHKYDGTDPDNLEAMPV